MSKVKDEKVKTRYRTKRFSTDSTVIQILPYSYDRTAYTITCSTDDIYIMPDPTLQTDEGFLIPQDQIYFASLVHGEDTRMPVYARTVAGSMQTITVREDYQEEETGAR